MNSIKVINRDGQAGTIPLEDWSDEAIEEGYRLVNSHQALSVTAPDGRRGNIPLEDWLNASKEGYSLSKATALDRAKEVGQGAISSLGGLADVANKYVAAPVAHAAGYAADLASYSAKNMGLDQVSQGVGNIAQGAHDLGNQYSNSNAAESLPNSDFLKTESLPDEYSKYYKAAGEGVAQLLPFSAAGKGVQIATKAGGIAKMPWIQNLNKFLATDINATNAASFAGGAVGAELGKDLETGDPVKDAAIQTMGAIFGAVGGAKIPSIAAGTTHTLWKTLINPIDTIGKAATEVGHTTLAKITGEKINQEALEAANKLGLHLPPGLATDSALAKGLENTALKSWFSSKAYKEVLEKIPQGIIKEIDKNLDEIGAKIASSADGTASQIASGEYKAALESQTQIWKKQSKTLFENAIGSLNEADVMQVPQTLSTIKDMRATLSKGITAPEGAHKAVLDKLTELERNLIQGGNVKVADLVAEQQKLLKLGKYGEVKGYENYYNGIADTLTDELLTYKGNKSFADNYKPARDFYRENIINRIRTDMAGSLLKGQFPKEAFSYINTPANIKQLEHLLGDTKNAKELMGVLKRAKISQILIDSNVITSAGEFNSAAFIRMFGRESKEPLLTTLMGKNFKKVQANIMPIAEAITSSGKVLANPSGSANVLKDYGIIANASIGVASGVATGSIPLAGLTATSGAGLINIVSRAFANPKYLEKLIIQSNKPKTSVKDKLLKSSESILSNPAVKYNALKALSGGGLDFDRDKFLEDVKDSTDRSSFIYTPEEMKQMRKK